MIDLINDLVGANIQVFCQLVEETLYLTFVHVTESIDEIFLHGENTQCDILDIGIGNVGMPLFVRNQLYKQVCAHLIDCFLQSPSFSHSSTYFVEIGCNIRTFLNRCKQLIVF